MLNKTRVLANITDHFVKIPNKIFHFNLSCNDIAIYCYLLQCGEHYNPSIKEIALAFDISRPTVYRSITNLIKANIIYLIKPADKNSRRAAIYGLTNSSNWIPLSKVVESSNSSSIASS